MDVVANSSLGDAAIASVLQPMPLWSAAEILANFAPVPKSAGIYAWYFDETPPGVPTTGSHRNLHNQVLLYVGIAPKAAKNTLKPSTRTLRGRLRDHLVGNSEGSTLRLTLGCSRTSLEYVCGGSGAVIAAPSRTPARSSSTDGWQQMPVLHSPQSNVRGRSRVGCCL
jgi:hypothetical protein